MKPKGVTTQMKALDDYFQMAVFTLLLNRVHVLQMLCLILTEKHGSGRVTRSREAGSELRPFDKKQTKKH